MHSFTYPLMTLALSWQLARAIRPRGLWPAKDGTGVDPRTKIDEDTGPSVPTPCTCEEGLSTNEGGICEFVKYCFTWETVENRRQSLLVFG